MTGPTIQGIVTEINDLTNFLVSRGFSDDQNYPVRRTLDAARTAVDYGSELPMSSMLKSIPYRALYYEQKDARAYNVRMLDGALIQMSYEFSDRTLIRCRLAFLPSPDLIEFQNEPDLYLEDILFAEVVNPQVVAVPIRFDFDDRDGVAADVHHPQSHVTLGQYKNCRVAVTAPVTPGVFVGFVLRSFYTTAIAQHDYGAPCAQHRFPATITTAEAALLHITVP